MNTGRSESRFRIYVTIGGASFDARAFHSQYGKKIRGRVCPVKEIEGSEVAVKTYFWRSDVVEFRNEDPDRVLRDILTVLKREVGTVADAPHLKIIAMINQYVSSSGEVRSFYIEPRTLRLLADLGAGLDLNISPDVDDTRVE